MPTDHDQREDHPDSVRDLLSGERLRRLIREEPGLWPVVTTLAVVAITFVTALVVVSLESRNFAAAAVVTLVFLMTVMGVDGERRRNGRFGGLLWVATGFWGVVALASVVVVRWLSS